MGVTLMLVGISLVILATGLLLTSRARPLSASTGAALLLFGGFIPLALATSLGSRAISNVFRAMANTGDGGTGTVAAILTERLTPVRTALLMLVIAALASLISGLLSVNAAANLNPDRALVTLLTLLGCPATAVLLLLFRAVNITVGATATDSRQQYLGSASATIAQYLVATLAVALVLAVVAFGAFVFRGVRPALTPPRTRFAAALAPSVVLLWSMVFLVRVHLAASYLGVGDVPPGVET